MKDKETPARTDLDPVQAAELTWLVDVEARWENLRHESARARQARAPIDDLREIQKAYEAFRSRLQAYNKRYAPAHVPELLLNTSDRLGKWCRAMRDLYVCVENNSQGRCPTDLMEKAYRWADQLAARLGIDPFPQLPAPADIQDTIRYLTALSQWCDERAATATALVK